MTNLILKSSIRCVEKARTVFRLFLQSVFLKRFKTNIEILRNTQIILQITLSSPANSLLKKKLDTLFLWMGFNCLQATESLHRGSLLFTTKFPEIPGIHLINLRKMKSWVSLGVIQWVWTRDPLIGNPAP